MLSRTALREEFLARCTQGSDRSMVQNGSFTRYGWAVFLMGRWGNSSEPWVTLYRGDNTIRVRQTYRREQLARPYYHDGRRITHREVETGNLVVELVEGRVHGSPSISGRSRTPRSGQCSRPLPLHSAFVNIWRRPSEPSAII